MTKAELAALEEQTSHLSSTQMMRNTAAYETILDQGEEAVPDLIAALRNKTSVPFVVMTLLSDITGENPVEPADRGYVSKMVEAWLDWADDNA
jgi:hypothetical protein